MKIIHKMCFFTLLIALAGALFTWLPVTLDAQETTTVPAAEAAATEPAADAAEPAAEPEATIDSGDTAWMIVATAIVLFMTIPGLSLFYGGLARRKNILSVLVQCFAITCVMTILWLAYGYSLAYTDGEGGILPGWMIGGMGKAFLSGVTVDTVDGTIPESVFFTFQMTFAIITPALIVGAFAERMKFSAVLIFMVIWFTLSYLPIWHMVWGGGLIAGWGAMDFAGGTVVHINAGVAGLVACIMVGKRKGLGSSSHAPHNVPFVLIGAAILWVGWFGFNAGSELAADGTAGMAQLVTQVATATAALTWMFIEWAKSGKPTAVGIATGAVAGLVAITPASGSAGPIGALIIGVAAGAVCFWGATSLKKKLGYDDSFDVFGVHGIGGIVGAILTGVCGSAALGGAGLTEVEIEGVMVENTVATQVWIQLQSVGITIVWSAVAAFIGLKIAGMITGGIRSTDESEEQGLDLTDHGESGYSS
jgi:Amt family ammonium transporter